MEVDVLVEGDALAWRAEERKEDRLQDLLQQGEPCEQETEVRVSEAPSAR